MYTIIEVKDPRHGKAKPVAEVATLEEAEAYLKKSYTMVVCFERDQDHDAADAVVTRGASELLQFSIERSA